MRGRLLGALHRHEPLPNARSAHRLADRRGVGLVVLAARHIGLHVLRRQQNHLMAQLLHLTSPIMRPAAGLHPDRGRLQLAQEVQEVAAPHLLLQHHHLAVVDAMELENALRRVNADSCYLGHGRLL
jgi:hypothetical protein